MISRQSVIQCVMKCVKARGAKAVIRKSNQQEVANLFDSLVVNDLENFKTLSKTITTKHYNKE